MKLVFAAPLLAALALTAPSVQAQTSTETKVSHDTDVKDGVATQKTKVTTVKKRKTHRPKKVLGVKVGHKTAVSKTVRETSVSTNGDTATSVKTSH